MADPAPGTAWSLDDLRALAAVAEAGGFRSAARRLGVPASTLSDIVRRLEAHTGVRLLHRSTRSTVPTEAGHRLLAQAGPALEVLGRAVSGLRQDGSRVSGTLRVTAPEIVARYVLPSIVPGFMLRHPGVHVDVSVGNSVVDIVEHGFDAAIRYEEKVARDMVAVRLGPPQQRFMAAAAPAYLDRHGRPARPGDLASHHLIGHRLPDLTVVAWEFRREGRTTRVVPAGPLTSPSIDLRVAAAVAGVGILYTFEEIMGPLVGAGTLEPVLEPWWLSFPGPLLCYYGRDVPAPLRAFIDHVRGR